MLRPTAEEVTPIDNYKLRIKFDNGERKIFDVKPYIRGSWFEELQNISYFKSVNVDGFTVAWPNGQDICPDELYYSSISEELPPLEHL